MKISKANPFEGNKAKISRNSPKNIIQFDLSAETQIFALEKFKFWFNNDIFLPKLNTDLLYSGKPNHVA